MHLKAFPLIIDGTKPSYPWIILFLIVTITVLTVIAASGVVIVIPDIVGELALSSNQSMWIATGFLMMIASCVPWSIFLADKIGYKEAFFWGTCVYVIASSLTGISTDYFSFMFFRLLSAVGVGIIFPVSISILVRVFPEKSTGMALAFYTALGFGIGGILGFYLGGVIAQYESWRLIFYINCYIGIPCLLLILFLFESRPTIDPGKFDAFGYGFFVLFVCSILMILSNAKALWNTEGWGSSFIIGCEITAVISFALFCYIENTINNPLFKLQLFKIHSFSLGCILIFFIGGVYFSTTTIFPNIFLNGLIYSKVQTGIHMVIFGAAVGLVGAFAGSLLQKIGVVNVVILGSICIAFSCFMQHTFTIYADHLMVFTLLAVRGAGVGLSLGPVTALALKDVPKELGGNASIIVTICRQMGAGLLGSLIELIAYDRNQFHLLRFSEQLALKTPEYEKTIRRLSRHIYSSLGENSELSIQKAKGLVNATFVRQSEILSINDGYLIIGCCVLVVTLMIGCLISFEILKSKINQKNR
jgi:EmrB/QacA subfamily drug resistance transporter